MRRQRILRASSAQSLCIFCACRLGVQVPPSQAAPLISPNPRRDLNTRSASFQQSAATASSNDYGTNSNDASSFVFNPDSSLTLAEQQEKFRRVQASREQQTREQQLKQEQIWRQTQERHKAAENERRTHSPRDGRSTWNGKDKAYDTLSLQFESAGNGRESAGNGRVEGSSLAQAMSAQRRPREQNIRGSNSRENGSNAAQRRTSNNEQSRESRSIFQRSTRFGSQETTNQQRGPKKTPMPSFLSSTGSAGSSSQASVSDRGAGGTGILPVSYGVAKERESAIRDVPVGKERRPGRDSQRDQTSQHEHSSELPMRRNRDQFSFRPQNQPTELPLADNSAEAQQSQPHGAADNAQTIATPPRQGRQPKVTPFPASNLGSFGFYEDSQPDVHLPKHGEGFPRPGSASDVSASIASEPITNTTNLMNEQRASPQHDSIQARNEIHGETPAKVDGPQDGLDFRGFGMVSDIVEHEDVGSAHQSQQSSQRQSQIRHSPQNQIPPNSGYRAIPFDPKDFEIEPSNELDNSANWQHLRRKTSESHSAAAVPHEDFPQPPATSQSTSSNFDDEDWVDKKFEEHLQSRSQAPQPPPLPMHRMEERDSRPLSHRANTGRVQTCARCGEKGHIARDCTAQQSRMKCFACGEVGHSARNCPNKAPQPRRFETRRPFDDPFEDERSPQPSQQFKRPKQRGRDFNDPFASPQVEQRVPDRRSQSEPDGSPFDSRQRRDGTRRANPFMESDAGSSRYPPRNDRQRDDQFDGRAQRRGRDQDKIYSAPAQPQEEDEEAAKRQDARASRRSQKWADAEDQLDSRSSKYGKDKKERRGGRRDFDDDVDEEAGAREEYRARKAARQAEETAAKGAKQKALRQRREAKKAGQTTPITLPEWTSVQQLSQLLGVRYEQFVERLEDLGYDDIFPGKTLNSEISGMIAMEYNFEPTFVFEGREEDERDLKAQPEPEDKELLPVRPPVVTIMGHVDHGKTTILDYLRKSSVAAGEAGGITQHIGAFSVPLASSGKTVTFLDTPGHAAFLAMRQRGANVTDIVILVVAADDSVKPQTLEALKHAKAAGVPMIVAINKVDKEEADIQRCKQDLARHGVEIEDFGGETQVVCVSGKTGRGMDELEENVVTLSEILDHRADTSGGVEGWVLEATTKKAGRVATVLVRRGILKPGSVLVAGKAWTRVRSLRNEGGFAVSEVGPGMPVEVDGWRDQPMAGDEVLQAESEQQATSVVDFRLEKAEREKIAQDTEAINETRRVEQEKREREKATEAAAKRAASASPEDEAVSAERSPDASEDQQSGQMTVPFIIKGDVSGSVEAVSAYILSVSNPLITPQILSSGVGAIHESDIDLANAALGHIIAFNLPADPDMKALAEHRGVKILENNIIYRVLDDVKAVLEEKLPPIVTQRVLGEAEIAAEFEIGLGGRKKLKIAGCKVRNGVMSKGARVRVTRAGEKVYEGTITSLKNVKKDVQEMRKGTECGMGFDGWESFQTGDQIQTFVEISEKRKL